ncbi:RNA polymerase sigma-70 factor [Chitinophaga caseinilytica]|uniref:RNA polymerase sigma-70 factor n=1 Tax=Chitinophaga caseinilytica TaxID=2267521 RepID=UPI003C2ECC75
MFSKYQAALVGFALSYVKDLDAAQDIVQDVFTRIWNKIDAIEQDRDIKSLLFTATKNGSISYLRSLSRSQKHQTDFQAKLELVAIENTTIATIELKELQARLNEIMQSLPEDCREIFMMNREDGLRYIDIAKYKNISVKTVEKKMNITLKRLRHKLMSLFWSL